MRILAAVGKIQQAPTEFQRCDDVNFGGVLFALPALLACGLLRHSTRFFTSTGGYYSQTHIFTMLAFMALCRIKTIEELGYTSPGEWGKLIGLDRCPAVKTLRKKVKELAAGNSETWAAQLSEDWMREDPANIGVLYIDGHTRVYHGHQTKLPRHYVARQKLCLRATTDYWVNGFDGLPFFKINQAVDPGMIKVLEEEIIPTLEKQIPNQPTEAELKADLKLAKFRIIFDREGYSPALFKRMNARRIACQTYHKYPGENWPEKEFETHQVKLTNGEKIDMQLGERQTLLGSKPSEQLKVREIRKLTESGRQIAIISTEWQASPAEIAGPQFGRWSQENFFKYGRQHFNLDRLIDYKLEPIDDTTKVVNPAWRKLDGQIRSRAGKLTRSKARLHDLTIRGELSKEKAENYMEKSEALREQIDQETDQLTELKNQRRNQAKHIAIKDLPEEEQFLKLANRSKHFIDTLKIIAYRAETALAQLVREHLNKHHEDEARAFVRDIYTTEANLLPDREAGTLTVELHSLATPKANKILRHLCTELNATETIYPDTNLRLIFKSVSE
jgi:hypothetical protein